MKRLPYILVLLVQAVLFVVVKDDPFFGDSISSTVRATGNIYDNRLQTIFYPVAHDPGHPTLYAWLLAACWTVLGKSLWVSHLFSCLWATALAAAFIKIARLFLDEAGTIAATLLLLAYPTYLSQSAMMLNTVALMCFFLLAFYGLITNRARWQLAGACLMMLTHTQCTFMLLGLACTDLLLHYKEEKNIIGWAAKRWVLYALPFALYAGWIALHYQHSGWAVHSPNYTDADELNGIGSFFKSLLLIGWRLVDFGMITVYLVIAMGWWRKQLNPYLAKPWLCMLAINALVMAVFLEHTIGHRYFLAFNMLALILAVQYTAQLPKPKRVLLFVLLLSSLLAGNFLYYPGKTLGDGTLAYRNYLGLEKQLQQELPANATPYSYAPIANEPALRWLRPEGFYIRRIDPNSFSTYPIIVQSNVNAEFTPAQKDTLQTWYGKSYESGAVYINVYLNPRYYQKPQGWQLREPTAFEKWFGGVRNKLR